jgi:phage shock protein PspC (stress-responsive transcriptional regulator)
MSRRDQPLYRDTADKKIGGVCSGLARYFDLDPLLVRVAMVAGIFVSGVTLIVYPLLWWLMEPAPEGHWTGAATAEADTTIPPPAASDAGGQQAA